MTHEANKAVVRRYFEEVLDAGNRRVMAELFVAGAKQHFPRRDLTFDPRNPGSRPTQSMATTLHHLLADGDLVVAHLTHYVTYGTPATFVTRLASRDVGGHSITWDAVAIFRLQDGKIVEEWINRDELNVLAQLDAVTVKSAASPSP